MAYVAIEAPSDRRNREVEDHLGRRRNSWYLTTVPEIAGESVNLLNEHVLLDAVDALKIRPETAYYYAPTPKV